MLTQCPACHTSFHITGSILRAAHGQVRCGHCNTQFDAIEHLIDSDAAPNIESSAEAPAESTDNASARDDILVVEPLTEEITLEGRHIEISGTYRTLSPDGGDDHTQTIVQEFTVGDDVEPIAASDLSLSDEEDIVADDLTRDIPDIPAEPASPAIHIDALSQPHATSGADQSSAGRMRTAALAEPIYTELSSRKPAPHSGDEDFGAVTERQHAGLWWSMLSLIMLVTLAAQVAHHYRQDLARRADVGPYLSRIYSVLGLPLEPRWDLAAYSVKQWGVVSDPNTGGTLRVRASIANHAAFAQPYPLLRLTLEDRFGAQVGTRDLRPEEYLNSESQAKRLLGSEQSANADIAIVDPGEEAVGFHLNVCLPRAYGSECTS